MDARRRDGEQELLDEFGALTGGLDLGRVLENVVKTAQRLVGARYAALGIVGADGTLVAFVHTGMDADVVESIGHLPSGRGVLGTLIVHPQPVRVPDIAAHPDAVGFPAHHPPMHSFLGVPVRVGYEVFGNLYLTDKQGVGEFTAEDQDVLVALAGAAGAAVANARLHAAVGHRERALRVVQEVATSLLSGTEPDDVLDLIAQRARVLFGAGTAVIALPAADGASLRASVAAADHPAAMQGMEIPSEGSLSGHVLRTGEMVLVADASADARVHRPMADALGAGPLVIVPLWVQEKPFGVLALARAKGVPRFDDDDLTVLQMFASQASIVLEHARTRQELGRLALLEDQERIARDLHDTVIQRLFAVGMALQGAARLTQDDVVRGRLDRAIDDIDATIVAIRSTIFALDGSTHGPGGLRRQAMSITAEVAESYGLRYRFTTEGPVDTAVRDDLAGELLSTFREAASNAGRHADAQTIDVVVSATPTSVHLRVRDDGRGMPPVVERRSGVRNMAERAQRLGGTCEIAPAEGGGTAVDWYIPLV